MFASVSWAAEAAHEAFSYLWGAESRDQPSSRLEVKDHEAQSQQAKQGSDEAQTGNMQLLPKTGSEARGWQIAPATHEQAQQELESCMTTVATQKPGTDRSSECGSDTSRCSEDSTSSPASICKEDPRSFAPILGRAIQPSHHGGCLAGNEDGVLALRLNMLALSGFQNDMLNQGYVEHRGWAFQAYGKPTFWSRCSSFFMFRNGDDWCLAPAADWIRLKLGRSYTILAFRTIHSSPPHVRWHEVVHDQSDRFLWNLKACDVQRETVIDVQVKAESLLETIPGAALAEEHMAAFQHPRPLLVFGDSVEGYTSEDFVQICDILLNLPADNGRLALALRNEPLTGFDAVFAHICQETQKAVDMILHEKAADQRRAESGGRKRPQTREEPPPLSPQELQRLEERSNKVAAQLVAQEEREKRKLLSKTHQLKKKKGKGQQQKASAKAACEDVPEVLLDNQEGKEPTGSRTSTCDNLGTPNAAMAFSGLEDISEPVARLRHNFPMFDDEVLSQHLMEAAYDLEKAVLSLSKLEAEAGDALEPVDIPRRLPPVRSGQQKRLIANVLARTDHPNMPLYCFIAIVTKSTQSEKYRPGQIVRPIPEDRFRLLGDEKGHFWLKKSRVPEIGDIIEMHFFQEDCIDYLDSVHGDSPHQNEDLLCTALTLKSRCLVEKNAFLSASLMALAVDDIETKWPWKKALGKFPAVTPGKSIWYTHPKKHLQSVLVMKVKRPETVNFKYRGATNDRVSVDFSAGRRFLRDIAVTAAGFHGAPMELNAWFAEKSAEGEQLFVLGLARAESRWPQGYTRLEDVPEHLRRDLDVDALQKYCQILLIGILSCPGQGSTDVNLGFEDGPKQIARSAADTSKALHGNSSCDEIHWEPHLPSPSVHSFFEHIKACSRARASNGVDGSSWRPSLYRPSTQMSQSGG